MTPAAPTPLTLADLLSLSRVGLAGVVWLVPPRLGALLPILALAALTDMLDGFVARHRPGGPAPRGAWLDPLCDKIFVVSTLVALFVALRPPLWLLLLTATRDLLVAPFVLLYRLVPALRRRLRVDLRARIPGKATTVAQFATLMALLLDSPLRVPLALLSAALGLVAAADYLYQALPGRRGGDKISAWENASR